MSNQVERDCNNCKHHVQGDVPPRCTRCLGAAYFPLGVFGRGPHLPDYEPKENMNDPKTIRFEQAQKQRDAEFTGAFPFLELDPTSQPGAGTMIKGGVLLA